MEKLFKAYIAPEHGWTAVPKRLLVQLNIADKISSYSFISKSGKVAYLEEDSDNTIFYEAYKKKFGKAPKMKAVYINSSSKIKNLNHYKAKSDYAKVHNEEEDKANYDEANDDIYKQQVEEGTY